MYQDYLSFFNQELIRHFDNDGLFNPEYVTYDEKGRPVKASCMRCGKHIPNEYRQLPELKARRFLEGGAYIELLTCDNCRPLLSISSSYDSRIIAQILSGLILEMEAIGWPQDRIKSEMAKYEELIKFKE